MSLITEYPLWYLLLCAALAAAVTAWLYWRDKRLEHTPVWLRTGMSGLRWLALTLIAFFLLHPLLKTVVREVEKPVILIGQDNSESLLNTEDSTALKENYLQELQKLTQELGEKYEVATFHFGESVEEGLDLDFADKQTDVSQLFTELYTRYSNRNVGAILLGTDGIVNRGASPLYATGGWNVPVYTVALGDTSVKKDLVLSKVAHNRLAYLGNEFPLEVLINARRCNTDSVNLTVAKGGQTLLVKRIGIAGENFTTTVPLLVKATATGMQRYTIRVSEVQGEVTTENNSEDIFIDVLDGRQKILVLSRAPHPDVAALRNAIASNDNYEVVTSLASEFTGTLSEFNLVVFHQLPARGINIEKLLAEAEQQNLPSLFVLGSMTEIGRFNQLGLGLQITVGRGQMNESQALTNTNFSLFNLQPSTQQQFAQAPPLNTPFGNYQLANASVPLFYQRIGLVETKQPLWTFFNQGERKIGLICGEGIWRWRLADYQANGNATAFQELISKTAQYLSVKADKSYFRVNSNNYFLENETIRFDAEVYNKSYELITEPEVSMEIRNEEGLSFPFTFSRSGKGYRLDAGTFPVGLYTYEAQVSLDGKVYVEAGEFTVSPVQVEQVNSIADHQVLFSLSERTGGSMLQANELAQLPALLASSEDVAAISYSRKTLVDLINERWIFFFLLLFLGLEWFLRKRQGAY
ncbi:MAG: hypothetical protein ACFB10_20560 [Salibacteraceae bacterium]